MDNFVNCWKTGIQNMDYVTGISNSKDNGNMGTTFQVSFENDEFMKPSDKYFSKDDFHIRDCAKGVLGKLEKSKRIPWLIENLTSDKPYLSDFPNCKLRFTSLGGAFLKLDNSDINRLNSGEWIEMSEVFNMFPRKPGSKAKRHTLIFRGGIWAVIDEILEDSIEDVDIFFDLIDKTFSDEKTRERVCVVDVGELKIGLCDESEYEETIEFDDGLNEKISWFTPGILKSLIQKCIRFNATYVEVDGVNYENLEILHRAFLMLAVHPGTFVPDLQKHVSGIESAMKRLAVSIVEDSYSSTTNVLTLFLAALAGRQNWKFSSEFLEYCLELCSESLGNNYLDYDFNSVANTDLNDEDELMCKTLDELKSFQTDINMLRSACERGWIPIEGTGEKHEVMDISHCFDHHCTTDVLYLLNLEDISPKEAVNVIWRESSKYNSRKHSFELNKEATNAKKRYWKFKTMNPDSVEPEEFSTCSMKRKIDYSWISGIIGPVKTTINGSHVLGFFHPDNISNIVSARDASRKKDQPELTDEEKQMNEKMVLSKFEKFTRLKEKSIGIDHDFIFKDEEFFFKDEDKNIVSWKDFCDGSVDVIEIGESDYLDFDEIVDFITTMNVDGVITNWEDILDSKLTLLPISAVFRISMYIRSVSDEIATHQISRDGTGTYLSVNFNDLYVFRFLCFCCFIAPGALKVKKSNSLRITFDVTNMFIWNNIKAVIFKFIGNCELYDWNDQIIQTFRSLNLVHHDDWTLEDFDSREMMKHQRDATEQIMGRIQEGKRGNIIWIPPGGGKTFIVINILFRLIQRKALPKYVVFTLPKEAYTSVENEFRQNKYKYPILPVRMLNGNKGRKNKDDSKLKPFYINFIKHDQLKSEEIYNDIVEHSSEIFFVFDEFHKMLATNTQRTSVALEFSNICQNFIALSGTLLLNSDPSGLIEWTKQVVDFKLTKNNYTVGAASFASSKPNYGIEENNIPIEVDIPEDHIYYSLVSSNIGGTARETKFREAVNECYNITQDAIVDLTLSLLNSEDRDEHEDHVFVVALNSTMQNWMEQKFIEAGKRVFKISKDNSISMTPGTHSDIDVVITTMSQNTGYNMTACKTKISGIYFSNQASRTQMDGRIIRLGQPSPYVNLIYVHCGILSYTMKHYDDTKSLEKALSDLVESEF